MNKFCECCWEENSVKLKGIYHKLYNMVMCLGCLNRTIKLENDCSSDGNYVPITK